MPGPCKNVSLFSKIGVSWFSEFSTSGSWVASMNVELPIGRTDRLKKISFTYPVIKCLIEGKGARQLYISLCNKTIWRSKLPLKKKRVKLYLKYTQMIKKCISSTSTTLHKLWELNHSNLGPLFKHEIPISASIFRGFSWQEVERGNLISNPQAP